MTAAEDIRSVVGYVLRHPEDFGVHFPGPNQEAVRRAARADQSAVRTVGR